MATPDILALSFCALLALFTAGVGVRSLVKGKLWLVPADITRKDSFRPWLVGVAIQLLTGVAMLLYFVHMLTVLRGAH
jgi:hypothetical protein